MLYNILMPIAAIIFGILLGIAIKKFRNSKVSGILIKKQVLPGRQMVVLVRIGGDHLNNFKNIEDSICCVAGDVMLEVVGGVPEFEPFIRFYIYSEFSTDFTVILRAKSFTDQYMVKEEFIKRLHKRLKEEGIEVSFPIRTIHLKRGG